MSVRDTEAADAAGSPLSGCAALVTGASSGIGAATALVLARQGAAVALVARRTATSLYECGVGALGSGRSSAAANGGDLGELLTTFPQSPQAAKVEPAVSSMIDKVAKGLKGSDPCSANTRLHTLSVQASALPPTTGAWGPAPPPYDHGGRASGRLPQ